MSDMFSLAQLVHGGRVGDSQVARRKGDQRNCKVALEGEDYLVHGRKGSGESPHTDQGFSLEIK